MHCIYYYCDKNHQTIPLTGVASLKNKFFLACRGIRAGNGHRPVLSPMDE